MILADGALGTELLARGAAHPVDLWNLERPDVVLELQRAYRGAGAGILRTNTFNAKPGTPDWRRVIREGVRLAMDAAGSAKVLGSIGPGAGVGAAAEALRAAGCFGVILETFTDVVSLAGAVREARSTGPIIALLTLLDPALDVERAVGILERNGATGVGVNCMPPKEAAPVLARMSKVTKVDVWAFPSAGKPEAWLEPDCWAGAAKRLPGVKIIGGCCGAGPAHIAALRNRLG